MKRENLKRLKFTALKAYIFSCVLCCVNILHAFIRGDLSNLRNKTALVADPHIKTSNFTAEINYTLK